MMPASRAAAHPRAHGLARRYGDALRAGDGGGAEAAVEAALAAGLTPADVHALVISPAMERIGELWQARVIGVADEHLATSISERALMRLFLELTEDSGSVPRRERVLLAAGQGQHHVLGLRMVADVLEGAGFDVVHLGGDVPLGALMTYIEEHRPAVVGLSFGMPGDVDLLADCLGAIHHHFPEVRVVLGGRAVPPAFRTGGYPFVPTTREAVAAVEQVLAGPLQPLPVLVDLVRNGSRAPSGFVPRETGAPVAARMAKASEHAFAVARDQARRAEGFRDLALRDALTGLPNRRAFDDELLVLTGPGAAPGALLMIDVDGFKLVNDRLGHGEGGALLRRVGGAISGCLRPGDIAARFGGDEFAVVLPACTRADAAAIAERIRAAVTAREAGATTVSIGLETLAGDPRAALLGADTALYDAKRRGRDRVALAPLPVPSKEPA